ncbi:MAG TPA: HAD family hydrolase [Pseudolabrys sp.]|nr:HAD family hydrolase [Pseudolabrys sp.]
MASQRAVFLDRDGVIVVPEFRDGRSYAPKTLDKFKLYPDAKRNVERLMQSGFLVVVVTNQPDVGAGLIPRSTVETMHEQLMQELQVHAIKSCTHTRADNCTCRKPSPGMLVEAANDLGIDLAKSFMVGDRDSDVAAGKAAGCTTIFIDLGYTGEPSPVDPDYKVHDLTEATNCILGQP